MFAYAARINPSSRCAIQSEDPNFNIKEFNAWILSKEIAYFLRDETSPYDCQYIPAEEFLKMYTFAVPNTGFVFRQVFKNNSPLIDI